MSPFTHSTPGVVVGRRFYTGLHAVNHLSARTYAAVVPVNIRNERCTLGHAVAYGEWKFDTGEEFLYVGAERGATNYKFYEIAAEYSHKFVSYLAQNLVVDNGHVEQELHQRLVELGEHTCADDFLYNERHGDDELGLYGSKGFHDHARRRGAGEKEKMAARAECKQHLYRESEHVANGSMQIVPSPGLKNGMLSMAYLMLLHKFLYDSITPLENPVEPEV